MAKSLKILILEDIQDDVGLIEHMLRKEGLTFSARRVEGEDEFTESLTHFQPDVILADHALPQFNSLEALRISRRIATDVPFILVTGTVSEEFAVSCLKEGADDYVLKSNMARLPAAIHNALYQRQLQIKRRKAEQTLRKRNEELTKINKELDNFVYSVSHNLRAPLMSVLGLINLVQLESRKRGHDFDNYFSMMQSSIYRLDDTLKEILDYSRNARSAVLVSHVDLRKLLQESIDRLKFMEGFEDVQKSIRTIGDTALHTDTYRLSTIVSNLVANAVKYRDPAKQENLLDIVATVTPANLELVFSDNGIGISPDHLSRIFEMFFRATEKSEGAGLGLYIVREMVDKLGGEVKVTSTPGEGSVFTVILPHPDPAGTNKTASDDAD